MPRPDRDTSTPPLSASKPFSAAATSAADAPNLRQSVVCAEPEYIMRSRKRSSDALTWSGVTSAAT